MAAPSNPADPRSAPWRSPFLLPNQNARRMCAGLLFE